MQKHNAFTMDIPKRLIDLNYTDLKLTRVIEKRIVPTYVEGKHLNDVTTINDQAKEGMDQKLWDSKPEQGPRSENGSSEWNGIRISSKLNHAAGYSLPWINNTLLSKIKQNNKQSCFKYVEIPSRSETDESDKESIRKYTTVCRRIKRPDQYLFWNSSNAASAHMALISENNDPLTFNTLSVEECINKSKNNANAGYPTYLKKNNKRAINDARIWINKILYKPTIYNVYKNILLENPKILLHRFQPKLEGVKLLTKVRQVWCESYRIILLENYFFRNLIDNSIINNQKIAQCSTSSGLRNVDISNKIIYRMRNYIGQQVNKELFSLDYSKYDSTIPDFAIDLYFLTLEKHINMTGSEKKLYHLLRYYTKFGPIIYKGQLYFKRKGISSGSLLTNHFDSWWNLVLNYAADELFINKIPLSDVRNGGYNLISKKIQYNECIAVTGDDIIKYCTKLEIYYLQELCSYLGMNVEVNESTNDPDKDIFFLGRYWNKHCEPIQSESYFTAHICFRSTFYKDIPIDISEDLEPSRIISICAPYKNGFNYMMKTFYNYEPLLNLLQQRKFIYLKDFPIETKNTFISTNYIKNWKMF
jgi:hypothetical protein